MATFSLRSGSYILSSIEATGNLRCAAAMTLLIFFDCLASTSSGTSINSYLVLKVESYQIAKEAKATQRIDDEATAYQMILRPPYKNNWMRLVKFLSSNRNLFPELTDGQVNKIMKVVNMDQGRISSVPSGEDCMLAIKWWNEAKKMGWSD